MSDPDLCALATLRRYAVALPSALLARGWTPLPNTGTQLASSEGAGRNRPDRVRTRPRSGM
jgi:hypothetical protein